MVSKDKFSWMKHIDFILLDLLSLILVFIISYRIKFKDFDFAASDSWATFLLLVSLLNVIIALLVNPFSGVMRRTHYAEVYTAVQLTVINAVTTTVILYLFKIGANYSRELVLTMYVLYFVLSLLFRCAWKWGVRKVSTKVKTIKTPLFVIGEKAQIADTLSNILTGDIQTYEIKGIFLVDGDTDEPVQDIPVVIGDFVPYVLHEHIQEVLLAVMPEKLDKSIYKKLLDNGISVNIVIESALGFQTEKQLVTDVGVYKTLSVGSFAFTSRQQLYLYIKRFFDIIFSLIGIVCLIPITALVKAIYLLSGDTAPILYRQKRVGINGKAIRIYKYRTMVPNAGEMLQELLEQESYREEWQKNQKLDNDPRITKVGKYLRKSSLDELPQLINVLIGDMSLVGPRPLVEGELEAHNGLKLYQKVKPGITGWWGCNGRSNIDYRERLELEYHYVQHVSPYLDILCLIRTVFTVIKKSGAK